MKSKYHLITRDNDGNMIHYLRLNFTFSCRIQNRFLTLLLFKSRQWNKSRCKKSNANLKSNISVIQCIKRKCEWQRMNAQTGKCEI